VFERHSALAGALTLGGRDGTDGQRRLRIGEARGWGLVQIAAFTTALTELESAVRPVLNAELPKRIGEVVNVEGRRLLKTGSEQYWIIMTDGDDVARRLLDAVNPAIGAVTLLSHSRTCIFIEGAAVRGLLAAAIPLDFHPDVFDVGQFALTGLHHTPVLIHRSGHNRFEIFVMRTFARSVWEWFTDAALSMGYEVVAPPAVGSA
jgi:heterotetrameric sarcosine oxidase gamma subunit